jgi:transcriptional regulator with XRE-family HTH domain
MMNQTIRPVTLFRGVTRTARLVGVSQSHLSRVLHGQRKPGKDLEKKLRRMGIRLGEEAAV